MYTLDYINVTKLSFTKAYIIVTYRHMFVSNTTANLEFEYENNAVHFKKHIGETFYEFIVCKIKDQFHIVTHVLKLGDNFSQNIQIFTVSTNESDLMSDLIYITSDMIPEDQKPEVAESVFSRIRQLVS